jgi:hypothetical protein
MAAKPNDKEMIQIVRIPTESRRFSKIWQLMEENKKWGEAS